MYKNFIHFSVLIFLFSLLFRLNCSKNTLFKTEVNSTDRQTVIGTLKLSDNSDPDGIYIWLENIGVSAFTDDSGKFELLLPPAQSQPGGGINGQFRLFYYVSNYDISYSSVFLAKGSFVFNQGDINENGSILKPVVLKKIIDINTSTSPRILPPSVFLTIYITLTTTSPSSVKVESYKDYYGMIRAVFFKKIGDPPEKAEIIQEHDIPGTEYIKGTADWGMFYGNSIQFLSPGEYEVIPYIRIIQNEIPVELIRSLGENADKLHRDFLKLPTKQQYGNIIIPG